MNIRPIRTEADYKAALKDIESLFDSGPDTPKGDRLEVLVTLVEAYEEKHHKIPLPDPIEAINYHMERLGLSRRDLEPCIGSRARVSEILNRKRPLTLKMIRNLEATLGIPAAILVQRYDLVGEKEETGTCSEDNLYEVEQPHNQSAGDTAEDQTPEEVQRLEFEGTSTEGVLDGYAVIEVIPMPNWPRFGHFGAVTANPVAADSSPERITS
jgi:HTH-type transcriptional regulator/antitoxin HigA